MFLHSLSQEYETQIQAVEIEKSRVQHEERRKTLTEETKQNNQVYNFHTYTDTPKPEGTTCGKLHNLSVTFS